MIRTIAAGCLLASASFAAWSDTGSQNIQFQITCDGRPTMTVTKARYGLTTIKWPGNHFQVASGHKRSHLESGTKVSIVLFRNGDQMIVNKSNDDTYFSFDGVGTLVPCSRSPERENQAVQLQRTDASGKLES
ncbi:hypothetical protein AAH446_03615 [Erwinia sp. P6884]|uniref:hypothetical protein n=1 Tax=Erwinia sp. P6884 TaxID=3141450 RepID=UPI00318DEE74